MLSQASTKDPTRQLLAVLRALEAGDFAVRGPTSSIQAGASAYLAKPVTLEKLLSLLRV